MGESFGPWTMGADAQVLPHITSANIACGAHAGDPTVMRRTVRMARAAAVRIGAHPGFADRLLDESGNLRKFVNLFVADDDVRYLQGLDTPVPDGETVSIIPAVAGG